MLVSTTGTADADFESVGVFNDKYSKTKMQWCRLNDWVTARYIKLKLLEPVVRGHWTEIVEFALDTSDKTGPVPAVEMETPIVSESSQLLANYPNPFNPTTTLSYEIETASDVSLTIYNLNGKQVAELVNEHQNAGSYTIRWDASVLPSGVYFAALNAGSVHTVQRMLLVK